MFTSSENITTTKTKTVKFLFAKNSRLIDLKKIYI